MSAKGFQIEATSRMSGKRYVFAVAATSQMDAQRRLLREKFVEPDAVFNLQRQLNAGDIEKHGIGQTGVRLIA